MGLIRGSYNLLAAFVGLIFLPLGYLMIGKPFRGIMVSLGLILITVFTGGLGLLLLPVALFDIATGGKMG
jgi:hypothetical protein